MYIFIATDDSASTWLHAMIAMCMYATLGERGGGWGGGEGEGELSPPHGLRAAAAAKYDNWGVWCVELA